MTNIRSIVRGILRRGTAGACALVLAPSLAYAQDEAAKVPPLINGFKMSVPAFPGAWGGGMFATGGRGGRTIVVSNLKDNGPGSFREAIEASGPRTVVFRVAGLIWLERPLAIRNGDVTIAGQSAPGDGVCVGGHSVDIACNNVIIRHMRFRRGNIESRDDALGGSGQNIILDHCSISWGLDENVSLYRGCNNLTIQWTISSECLDLNAHAFGGTWGGNNATFHHNLFANNTGRNPSMSGGGSTAFDFRNNVVFNWRHRTGDGGIGRLNYIANYYRPGPATNAGQLQYRIVKAEGNVRPGPRFYVAGNVVHGNEKVTANNWAGGVQKESENAGNVIDLRAAEPFPAWPINQQTAREAFEGVLATGGASLPRRDAVDIRILESVRTGKVTFENGIITVPQDVGGWPEYNSGPVGVDTENDGMPDWWETKYKLNPNDPADANGDLSKTGFTNLEQFLNGRDPTVFVDYTKMENNVDLLRAEALLEPGKGN